MMRKLDCNSSFFSVVGLMEVAVLALSPCWRYEDARFNPEFDEKTGVDSNLLTSTPPLDQCGSMEILSIGNSLWEAIEHTASSVCRCANLRTRPRHAQWSRCAGTQPFGPTFFSRSSAFPKIKLALAKDVQSQDQQARIWWRDWKIWWWGCPGNEFWIFFKTIFIHTESMCKMVRFYQSSTSCLAKIGDHLVRSWRLMRCLWLHNLLSLHC